VINPSFLAGSVVMSFLTVSWGGVPGVLPSEWIFLYVMVGSVHGVAGPKELLLFIMNRESES
jgi:hypothetical protein